MVSTYKYFDYNSFFILHLYTRNYVVFIFQCISYTALQNKQLSPPSGNSDELLKGQRSPDLGKREVFYYPCCSMSYLCVMVCRV